MIRPDFMEGSVDVMLFRDGIKPMWEDDANRRGGKVSVKLRKGMANQLWEEVLLALVGEQFDLGAEICGAVLSVRFHDETLSIWNRSGDNDAAIAKIR
jgi:translation initiation factor 4E